MDIYAQAVLHPYLTLFGISVILALRKEFSGRSRSRLPLPPGPKGYPIVGNLFDMPQERTWLVYNEWFKIYGDMVYFKVFGQGYLILGSSERTNDLFEKRSTNYSDRMEPTMLIDLMQWQFNMAFLPYGSWWRRHRRAFHEHFHANAAVKYYPIQLRETHAFLRRLLVTPENLRHHIRHTFGATIMDVAYGINVSEGNDPYISTAEEALYGLSQAGIPGQFLVDFVPILKHIPSWFPGANFKRKADHWRRLNIDMAVKPFEHVKKMLHLGTAGPSLAATLIEGLPNEGGERRAEEEELARNTAAVAYVGGADTTVSAVQFFFLAMAMYPDVQRKAQAEIDAVVGSNRLPDFNDRQALPYVSAMVKETMRWQAVSPLAIGHKCSSDDEYNGTLLHDPEVYPSPEEYKPERWLRDGQLDPTAQDPTVAFGYGRRICPGRYMSDNSLYAMIALTLAVYNITPSMDDQGNPIPLTPEPTSGMLSYPAPYQCTIKPRSYAAEALIREHNTE
ncbi:cytochrome P450 [Collybia nuda]|uniref:Cytochrome P450 n=1 Tax=Collybia nuda TaxID=64659 RepID=A0A9P6C8S4_9AGAR|nr:cytochrome P450 [Collybia nuda]